MRMPEVEKKITKTAAGYTVTADENELHKIYLRLSGVKVPAVSETAVVQSETKAE